ncbi:transcription factor with AP2 domain(s), putative [Plasmodium berghei]|uniref:Transcription factor with AP2 domain(S), putative n=1 Tax=Plasmodium berghei TaxID=5821 RepID=A0A1D3SJJ2_PLABE|nr:transcription factor with AP2 domain(s), putative [Plasmodium berghei]
MDDFEINLSLENYLEDEKVLHNFPLKYIYILIYAYKNYYFNIYLKQKCKNKPNENFIEDLVNNINEDNVLDLSLNILKKRYNYKKKKKRILFDTSESINSNLSWNDKQYNEEESNRKKNKNSNIHDHSNLSGNGIYADDISTIKPNNGNNNYNSNISVIRSNGNNNSNNNYLTSKHEDLNPTNFKNKVYGFSKYFENSKSCLSKWRKNLNLANKNENVNCNEENCDDQSENYSERDIIFLIHYFMHKFVFSKDGKKKIKLTTKKNVIEKLEKLEKETLKMDNIVKSSNNQFSNAECFDKNDITGVCNLENNSFYYEQVIKNDEKKKNINNNEINSEKENKTSHNISENVISLTENCKLPEYSNKIKNDDTSCLEYHNDIKMVTSENKDNDNSTCADIGTIKDKNEWILEKYDQSENNNINNNEVANKDNTNLESSNNSIKWEFGGDKDCDKTHNESEIESFNEEMAMEIEKKKIYEIIENYFYKKNICFNANEIFYPFSAKNVNTRNKRKNKNKKLNKPLLPNANKCASVIESYDNKLSEQKYMKNKSLLSKLKKGLNLLLKNEKTKKKGKNKNSENSTSYVNNNCDENENHQINNDLKKKQKNGKHEYKKENITPIAHLKNNQENLKANVLKKCLLDVIDYSEMCMFSNNDNKNNLVNFSNKTKFNIGGNEHITNPSIQENNITQTYLDHQNDIHNNDNRRNNYNNFQNIKNRMVNTIDQRYGNELNNSRVYNNIYGNTTVNMQNSNIGDNRNKEILGNYNVNTNSMFYNNSGEYLKNQQTHNDSIHNNSTSDNNNYNLLQNRPNYFYNGRNNTNIDNNVFNHSMINTKDTEFHEKNKNMHIQNISYNNVWPTNMYPISNVNSFISLDPMNNQIERNCKTSGINLDTNDMIQNGNKRNMRIHNGIENENQMKSENMNESYYNKNENMNINYLNNNNISSYMYNNYHMSTLRGRGGINAKLNQRGCRRGRGRGRIASRINNNDYLLGNNNAPPKAKRGRKPLGKHLSQNGPRGRRRNDEIGNNFVPNIINEENDAEKKSNEDTDGCNDKVLKYQNKDNDNDDDDEENNGDNENYESQMNGHTSRAHTNVNPNNSENTTNAHNNNNNNNTTNAKDHKETSEEYNVDKTSSYLGKDEENENNNKIKKSPNRLSNSKTGKCNNYILIGKTNKDNNSSSTESIYNYNMNDDKIDSGNVNKDGENINPLCISNNIENNSLIKYKCSNDDEQILNLEEDLNVTSLNSKVIYPNHSNNGLNKIEKKKNDDDNNKSSKPFSHKNGYISRNNIHNGNICGYINSELNDNNFEGSMTNFYTDSNKNNNLINFRDNKNLSLQEESNEPKFTKIGLTSEKDVKQTKIKKTGSNFNTVLGVSNVSNLMNDEDTTNTTVDFGNFNNPNKIINNYPINNNPSYLKRGTLICNKMKVLSDGKDDRLLDFQINKQTYKSEYSGEENNKNKCGTKIKNNTKHLFENLEGNIKVINKNQGIKRRANKNLSIEDDEDSSLDPNFGKIKKLKNGNNEDIKNVDKHDISFDNEKYEQVEYTMNNEMNFEKYSDNLIDEYENIMNNKNKSEKKVEKTIKEIQIEYTTKKINQKEHTKISSYHVNNYNENCTECDNNNNEMKKSNKQTRRHSTWNNSEHNEEQINVEINKNKNRNNQYISNTLCNNKQCLYGSLTQNEANKSMLVNKEINLDRENFNYVLNMKNMNKELRSNKTNSKIEINQNNGDCNIENFNRFDENEKINKNETCIRSEQNSLQNDDIKKKKKKNEYELNDNMNKLNSSNSYNCTDIKSQDNDKIEEIEFYNNDNVYTIEKKKIFQSDTDASNKIFEGNKVQKENNQNDNDICNDDESINDLNEIGLESINSKKKGRKPKTTILKNDKINMIENKLPNKNFDEIFILNKQVEANKATDSKRRTKTSKRHQDLNFRVEKIETGAYNENGEKVSGVWYDTNRRLWRVMYIENDKRKTRGFSPRIYGFNTARDMAVQLKYEMNKKNKK